MTDDYVKKVAEAVRVAVVDSLHPDNVDLDAIIASVPKPEPSVWMTPDGEGWRMRLETPVTDVPLGWTPLYTEPVNVRLLALLTGLEAGPLFAQAAPHQLLELGKAIAAQAKSAAEQSKPVPELTDTRIQQLWNENASHTPNWNRHNAFVRAIERELRGEGK